VWEVRYNYSTLCSTLAAAGHCARVQQAPRDGGAVTAHDSPASLSGGAAGHCCRVSLSCALHFLLYFFYKCTTCDKTPVIAHNPVMPNLRTSDVLRIRPSPPLHAVNTCVCMCVTQLNWASSSPISRVITLYCPSDDQLPWPNLAILTVPGGGELSRPNPNPCNGRW